MNYTLYMLTEISFQTLVDNIVMWEKIEMISVTVINL